MKLSDFKFALPPELIARFPEKHRDESRLMILHRKTGEIEHKIFKEIINYFDEGDLFVFNNTKVFPSRFYARKEKNNARIEVLLLRELNQEIKLWDVLVDPARKIRLGNKLFFGENDELVAEVIDNTTNRGRIIRFLTDMPHDEFINLLKSLGEPPLPKIFDRPVIEEDRENYQTIFAKHEGAVVAPMAGFHFSRELLKRFEIKGINTTEITLHAGLGNFRKIEVEDLSKHKMEAEEFIITEEAADIINKTKQEGHKVCVVGTTTMKALESSVTIEGKVKPAHEWTNKFIFPPFKFLVADAMVTNFHLPMSVPMILVAAFAGYENLMKAYKVAVQEKYRFFAYGDALLIID